MKKSVKLALLFSTLFLLGGTTISAAPIDFGVSIIDSKPGVPGSSKSPVNTPCVDIEGIDKAPNTSFEIPVGTTFQFNYGTIE